MRTSPSQICQSCQEVVIFISEAFGSICPHCGTVIEEINFAWEGNRFQPRNANSSVSNYIYGNPSRISQEVKRHVDSLYLDDPNQSKPNQDAIIAGILARFLYGSLQREVQDLIVQVNALSVKDVEQDRADAIVKGKGQLDDLNDEIIQEDLQSKKDQSASRCKVSLHGEQAMARLAVAASFSVLKRYDKKLTLEDVWNVAAIGSLEQTAHTLNYVESLLAGTRLSSVSREDAHIFIPEQITFLIEQSNLQARERSTSPVKLHVKESILGLEEQRFIREAAIQFAPFRELALKLCQLCCDNGLHNRSAKTHNRKDLMICAWAIVMIAMESSCGRICNEGKMARMAVYFKSWLHSRLHTRLSPEESELPSRSAMEEMVKKRYVEISRMISTYLEHLPWLKDETPAGKKERLPRKKSKTKAIPRSKEGLASIKPYPRKIIAKYLADVIKLRPHLEKKIGTQIGTRESTTSLWSRFGSTEDVFHSIRRSENGQRMIKEEQEEGRRKSKMDASNWTAGSSEQSQVMGAIERLLEAEEEPSNISITNSLGSKILQYESLRDMSFEVVDSLLFLDGEMESYLRSPEEVQLVGTLRRDTGDWDTKKTTAATSISTLVDTVKVKRARTEKEEVKELHVINGKRTKAISEADAARILSLL